MMIFLIASLIFIIYKSFIAPKKMFTFFISYFYFKILFIFLTS